MNLKNSKLWILLIIIVFTQIQAEHLKPYILATECEMNVSDAVSAVREKLLEEEFEILGDYSPAGEDTRRVLIVTHDELIDAI